MLEIRPCCEHCGKQLPNHSREAMICSFECTYCKSCALDVFENVCPSCGGNFCERPIRPHKHLEKYPPVSQRIFQPKDVAKTRERSKILKKIPPEKR